jgi:hypothetical protein
MCVGTLGSLRIHRILISDQMSKVDRLSVFEAMGYGWTHAHGTTTFPSGFSRLEPR